jgi:hypothetical protein
LFDGMAVSQACYVTVEPFTQIRYLMAGLKIAGLLFAISGCSVSLALLSRAKK